MTSRLALVTGSRRWSDALAIAADLEAFRPTMVVHGGARGADEIAGAWARARGIACKVFKADWLTHGRAAGPKRNARMTEDVAAWMELGATAQCFAYPLADSVGTVDCIRQARRRGIPVKVAGE